MPLNPTRSVLRALLSGLVLSACGGMPDEAAPAPADEALGTQESALDCAGASITSLTIDGMDLQEGVLSGGGRWKATYPANAVYMRFFVNGVFQGDDTEMSEPTSTTNPTPYGTWNFNNNRSCGTHNFEVRAYPANVSSNGSREYCETGSMTKYYTVNKPCPTPPSDSLSCTQSSLTHVTCTGSASGGSGTYPTRFWKYDVVSPLGPNFSTGWHQTGSTNPTGSNSWTYQIACKYTGNGYYDPAGRPPEKLTISFKVMDSNYLMSPASRSFTYYCVPGTYF